MPIVSRAPWLLLSVLCVAVTACESPAPAPALLAPGVAVRALVAGPTGGLAVGRADLHATSVQNIRDETYSFVALSRGAYPAATGEFSAHALRFTGEQVAIRARVTCMSVIGTQAWIGARITRALVDGVEVPSSAGLPLVFTVRDVPADGSPADLASLFFLPAAADADLTYCNARTAVPILRANAAELWVRVAVGGDGGDDDR